MRFLAVGLLSGLLMFACATDDNDCESGRQVECACPGGAAGVQVCGDEGTWGDCECCEPDCRERNCGDDGCGRACGTCHDCDGQVNEDLCVDGQCRLGCCPATCEGLAVECGTWDDGCGAETVCGSCEAGFVCIGGICMPDTPECDSDEDCGPELVCEDRICRPADWAVCATREDCAGPVCLVCMDGACFAPPPICQGQDDCCVGHYCSFGTCIPECEGCTSDSDCLVPEFPRCNIETCVCEPELQGCDSNDDCVPPDTCNYATHECGQVDCCGGVCPVYQWCDNVICQCTGPDPCQNPEDCPQNYDCDLGTGRCMCTDAACTTGFHCDQVIGACMPDANDCDPANDLCPAGQHCDPVSLVCVSNTGQGDGDPCMNDEECGDGLLCDNDVLCMPCMIIDPLFSPTYTCRYECSLDSPQCQSGYECKMRRLFMGQCMPL